MNLHRKFLAVGAGLLLAINVFAGDTNPAPIIARDDVSDNYLEIQEQIHATQLAIAESQQAAADSAKSNADVLAARVPRHVLDPLPTIEATRLLLNSGAGLIGAARMAAGENAAADAGLVTRLYYNCAQSMADALLIGCQRFCTDPDRKQIHLMDIARFEPIVDQSGALLHLRRMAQDWQRVFLWIESVRLGLRFENLERYASWPGRREVPGTSLLGGFLANVRRGRLGWTHPNERVYRMLAVAVSDLACDETRFPLTADAALLQWREAQ